MKGRHGTTQEKFERAVTIGTPDECWLFHRGSRAGGYGLICVIAGASPTLAHRVAYELYVGPIPAGMFVLHSCDVPLCCNPAHLRAGTASDNQRDAVARGRHGMVARTHCPQGHPYDDENTAIHKTTGGRRCKACDRERHRLLYLRRKAAA